MLMNTQDVSAGGTDGTVTVGTKAAIQLQIPQWDP